MSEALQRLATIKRRASYADSIMDAYGHLPAGQFFRDLEAATSGVEANQADQIPVDSQVSGGSDPTVCPPTPTPPGGDTRLSGEVEGLIERLEVSWSDRGWVAAKKISGLLAEAKEAAKALRHLSTRLQACEAERDRRTDTPSDGRA